MFETYGTSWCKKCLLEYWTCTINRKTVHTYYYFLLSAIVWTVDMTANAEDLSAFHR